MLMLPYQKGWIALPGMDQKKVYSEFYTDDASETVEVLSLQSCPLFFIGMALVTHYLIMNLLCLTAITTERVFATYYVNDYESKKRRHISFSILIIWQLFAISISFVVCSMIVSIYYWLATGIIVMIANCMGLLYIWYWNVRVHRILNKSKTLPAKYTLQARFQTKENMRSFIFTKYSLFLISVIMILQYTLIMCQSFEFLQKYEVVLNYIMEMGNATHPNLIIPIMMASVPVWRKRFFGHFSFIPGVRKYVLKNLKSEDVPQNQKQSQKMETEEYFNQFKMAWG